MLVFDLFGRYSTLELVAGAFALGSTGLGLFISMLAFRGLRRYDSRPMRYLAVGLITLFGLTYTLSLLGQSLISIRIFPLFYQTLFRLVVRVCQFLGLALITYSLWLASRSEPQLS